MDKEKLSHKVDSGESNQGCLHGENEDLGIYSRQSVDQDAGLPTCRVCQCVESDRRGDAALGFLGITPIFQEASQSNEEKKSGSNEAPDEVGNDSLAEKVDSESRVVEFKSPEGEVFVCKTDLEMGLCYQDTLIELGCSCKNDLALVHYACALKWFINHGSTICEICEHVATNVKTADIKKIVRALNDYEALRERTASGEPNPTQVHMSPGTDPDAVAAICRQRLSEISLWFGPYNNHNHSAAISLVVSEQPLSTATGNLIPAENPAVKWAVEATGIILATGLLTVTLAWLIAPHVGKKTARSGLHIILGGIFALIIVIFFRFFVLKRIKDRPARYWAVLFVFWFLVFGIWASRTHGAHTNDSML